MMNTRLQVVVNADDLGLSTRVNTEVERLHQAGVLTSATIMANGPAIEEVQQIHFRNPELGLGVHLNASNFMSLTGDVGSSDLCDSRGVFHLDFRNRFRRRHISMLAEEWVAQVRKVQSLGIEVDHLDSHHHVHTWPWVFPVLREVSRSTGVRLIRNTRNLVPSNERRGLANGLKYALKSSWSQWLRLNGMLTTDYFCSVHDLRNLVLLNDWGSVGGTLELMCHPGDDGNPEYVGEVVWMESELLDWINMHGMLAPYSGLQFHE